MTSNLVLSKKEYKVVGTRPVRHDGVEKVTGAARYGADIHLPGMLHGKVLRSPHAHAVIKRLDTSAAEAHPSVRAVATGRDLADVAEGLSEVGEDIFTSLRYMRDNILAADKALYAGHPIAAVAADSPHQAEEALALIEVEYEVLPPVIDVEAAMAVDAPVLHERLATAGLEGEDYKADTNVASHEQYILGDAERGFEQSDIVIEREFRTKTVHQGYIEPQSSTVMWRGDGQVVVWASSQGHFGVRDSAATVLGLPQSKVKVIPMEIGGGFGGKLSCRLEPIGAVLSKKSSRPVKLAMTREEVLTATGPTSGSYVKMKIGASNDGRIVAAQGMLALEGGAFPGSPVGGAAACMLSPYNIENIRLDGHDVVTNKPKTTAYRAPGAPIGAFAVETIIDEICERLQMEPLEMRALNAAKEGTRRADGVVNGPIGMEEIVEAMRSHPHYGSPLPDGNAGRGIAFGYWRNNTGPSCAIANVAPDGCVALTEGSMDIGGSRTAVAQMLAEVLGIPVEDVHPTVGDTEAVGYTSVTGGSGVAFKTGWAAHDAAEDIKSQLIERAAFIWETDADNVEYVDGVLRHKADPELSYTFKEIAAQLNSTGGPVVGRANVYPTGVGGSHMANLVDVEVDPETGKVQVTRYTAFQDAGKAVHPSYVEGQMQGGSVQGIGWALNEEYFYGDDGRMANTSLLDYRMPTSLDVPMIDTVIVEVPNPGHPFGVRGVGESSIVPPMAAIANAIHNAVGVRMRDLPMNPDSVVRAIGEQNGAAE